MTDHRAVINDSSLQDRFLFSFKTINHEVNISFNEKYINHTIEMFIDFLLACGYNPGSIKRNLDETLKKLDTRWGVDNPSILEQE